MTSLQTVDHAIDVLFFLRTAPGPRGVTEVSRALGLPKSSVHRLLATLASRGLVESGGRRGYRLGVGLVALGLGALSGEPVVAAARPVLEAEAEALGETVFLTVARSGRITVLDKAEGRGFLRAAPKLGSEVPLHASAVGKLQLAFAPETVSLGADPFPAYTPSTPTEREALDRAVREARRSGYAENLEEWIPGLWVVAAPIFDRSRMAGALAVAAPSVRRATLDPNAVARRMQRAARQVGARLEGVQP